MRPSKELFHLIKSLTKSEKRYFKLTSSLQQGEKNYVMLFDAIEAQSEYDEDAIKELFKKATFIQHLPSEKNHLYGQILKSLRAFHSEKSVSAELQEYLKNIEILFNKALYKECTKVVRKAKSIAVEHEEFFLLLELINWERILLEEGYVRGSFNKSIDDIVEEEEKILEKLRNVAEYQILYSKINYVFRNGGFTRNEKERKIVNEIMNHHLIKGSDTALSLKASTACFYIQGLCAWTNHDLELAFTNFKKVMDRFNLNPSLIGQLPKRYTRVLNHQLQYYIETGKFDHFFHCLSHLKMLRKQPEFRSIDLQLRIFTFSTINELIASHAVKDHVRAEKVVGEILKGIEKYRFRINKEDIIVYYYNIARHYFNIGDHKKALEFINKVLNDNEANLRQDIFVFARLFNLVVHYELENYELLDYIIKSTTRFVQKKKRDYDYENSFIKYMRKLLKFTQSHQNIIPVLVEFKNEIERINQDPLQRVTIDYFDVQDWLDKKISGA